MSFLPSIAATVGRMPIMPTIAVTRISLSGIVASSIMPSMPLPIFYRKILHSVTEFCRLSLIADCRKLRMKFPDLLLEQCNITSGADADHLKIAVGTHDIEGLGSDRTG